MGPAMTSLARALAVTATLCWLGSASAVLADPTRLITPYPGSAEPSVGEIEAMRRIASRTRTIEALGTLADDPLVYGREVGIAWIRRGLLVS